MRELQIGDYAIGQNYHSPALKHLNGMRCRVVGGLEQRTGRNMSTGEADTREMYLVRWQNGDLTCVIAKHVAFYRRPSQHDEWAVGAVQKLMRDVSGSHA